MIAKKVSIEQVDSIRGYAGRLLAYITNPEVAEDPDSNERLVEKSVAAYFSGFSFCEPGGKKCRPDEAVELIDDAKVEMAHLASTCQYVAEGRSQPISHWILSFRERPSEDDLFKIGKDFVEDLGYDESHQIAMSIHNNRAYLHLHIVANRVSGWDNKLLGEGRGWEKNEAQKSCARAEKKYGLAHEEGNRFKATDEMESFERINPFTDQVITRQRPVVKCARKDRKEPAITPKAKSLEMRSGLKSEQRSLQEVLKEVESQLKPGLRFGDLWRMFAERGVEVQTTQYGARQGLAFSLDGKTWVKASKVNSAFTAASLEKSLATPFRKPQMRRLEKTLQKAREDMEQDPFSRLAPRVNVEIPHTRTEIRQIVILASRPASGSGSKKWSGINLKGGIREIASADKKLAHGCFSGQALLEALLEMLCGGLKIGMDAALSLLSSFSGRALPSEFLSRPPAKTGIQSDPKEREERLKARLKAAGIAETGIPKAKQILLQMDALQARSYIVTLKHREIVRGNKIDVLQALQRIPGRANPVLMPQEQRGNLFVFRVDRNSQAQFEASLLLEDSEGEIAAFLCKDKKAGPYSSLINDSMRQMGFAAIPALPLAGFGGTTLKAVGGESAAFESWATEVLGNHPYPETSSLSTLHAKSWRNEQIDNARERYEPEVRNYRTEERLNNPGFYIPKPMGEHDEHLLQ